MAKDSLHGNDFAVVQNKGMIPAFEVLRSVGDYCAVGGVNLNLAPKTTCDASEKQLYSEYVACRRPYLHPDDAQMPDHLRSFYRQLADGLRGPDWNISTMDPCFATTRDGILRELTTIGLTRPAWHYVVDSLPNDLTQLKGALLVIMPEKFRGEWKTVATVKLNRLLALSCRLRFLLQLSQVEPNQRSQTLQRMMEEAAPGFRLPEAVLKKPSQSVPKPTNAKASSQQKASEISVAVVDSRISSKNVTKDPTTIASTSATLPSRNSSENVSKPEEDDQTGRVASEKLPSKSSDVAESSEEETNREPESPRGRARGKGRGRPPRRRGGGRGGRR